MKIEIFYLYLYFLSYLMILLFCSMNPICITAAAGTDFAGTISEIQLILLFLLFMIGRVRISSIAQSSSLLRDQISKKFFFFVAYAKDHWLMFIIIS